MSNSPWSSAGLIAAIRAKAKMRPEFQTKTMLLVDERPMKKPVSRVPRPGGNPMTGWAKSK